MFGILLKTTMKKYDITGKNLSIFTNLTEGFISDIKTGKTLPREENLNKILDSLQISNSEKLTLRIAWEKSVSPLSFVKRFEELENDYEILASFYIMNDITDLSSIKNSILNLVKENQKLEIENKILKQYRDFFNLMHEDDIKYLANKVSFLNKKKDFSKILKRD